MSESIWNDPRITAYVLDELSSEDRAAFEDELKSNPELELAIDQARLVTGKLEGLYAAESTPPLDADRRQQILSAEPTPVVPTPVVPTTASSSSETSKRSWRLPAAAFAAAATLLLLVGLAPWLRDQAATPTLSQLPPQAVAATRVADNEGEVVLEELALGNSKPSESIVAKGTAVEYDRLRSRDKDGDDAIEVVQHSQVMNDEFEALAQKPKSRDAAAALSGEPSVSESLQSKQLEEAEVAVEGVVTRSLNDVRAAAKREYENESGPRSSGQDEPLRMPSQQRNRDEKFLQRKVADLGDQVSGSGKSGEVEEESRDLNQLMELGTKDSDETIRFLAPKPADGPMPVAGAPINRLHAENPLGNRALALDAMPAPAPAKPGLQMVDDVERLPARGRLEGLSGGFALPRDTSDIRSDDLGLLIDEGRGPGVAGDRFEPITDNPFQRVSEHSMSTFSVDVDTASYSKVRDFLMRANQLPRPDAVRIEEMVNYFDYDYEPPAADDEHPFAARVSVTSCPWNEEHRLARIALKGKTIDKDDRPPCNLVFLLDTSGSMNAPNKLPLVLQGMQMLLGELNDKDKVAIVVYAGSAGLVLDSTSAGKDKKIRKALTQLSAGGSTNGGAGIALAYQTARSNFITEGVNRVILCTDGDFNVGTTGTDALVRMVEEEAKGGVFLSVLGFGMGNHNDAMLEKISGRGNGNYAFIDTENEARKVLVDQTSGTLVTIAKDVKLQIEFNPAEVSSYRLIGYENRILASEDFNDDKKDAGEIGAGHAVTALYEVVPAGVETDAIGPKVDDLVYQTGGKLSKAADSGQMMMLKLRYKQPDGDTSTLVKIPVTDHGGKFESADDDVRFAAAVAGFGMQLRRSQYAGSWTLSDALKVARVSRGDDRYELRAEFIEMVRRASEIMGQE